MDRRDFIRTGLATGAGAVILGTGACVPGDPDRGPDGSRGAVSSSAGAFDIPDFPLEEITFDELAAGLATGAYTCRSITEAYLARIEALDRQGPRLFAVLETNPDALEIADALDAELRDGGSRGPLHGVPVLLKDNIDTADRMTTTAGSTALRGSIAPRDAMIAAKLRDAGAILLGKANMSEWAGFKSFERGTSGWSGRGWDGGRGGLCRNPYALDRSPGGSSAGSGAGCSANLAAAAVGTETDGSVVGPTSRNCLVGLKPTLGLMSRGGVIPIAHSQDSAGPMARTVRDAAILLGAMAGPDPRDPMSQDAAQHVQPDYTAFLDPDGLRGARIGVARGYLGFDERVDALLEDALDVMRGLGATVIDPITLPEILRFGNDFEMEVLYHEFKADLNAYLASLGPDAPVRTLEEVIAYNEQNPELELSLFGHELLTESQARGPLTDARYTNSLLNSRRVSRQDGIDRVMDEQRLDAIVGATSGIPELHDYTGATGGRGGGCSTPSAMAGYPNMSVPMGFLFGLPVGMSLFGRAWSEPMLLRLAYAYEQATNHRRPPRFLTTIEATTPRAAAAGVA
ncbi:MAG: amidase [Gemmatimonadota bacterium]